MRHKKTLLPHLKRAELQLVVTEFDLEVRDRRVRDDLEESIESARHVKLPDVLSLLTRNRLTELCVELGVEYRSGTKKDVLVARLAGMSEPEGLPPDEENDESGPAHTGPNPALDFLQEKLGRSLVLSEPGSGWPARGTLHHGDARLSVALYVRPIGGSGRGNHLERRFQNPGNRQPIEVHGGEHVLLLGVWTEQGDDRVVIAAMDGYRRLGRAKRFSLFMPLSLLEDAADTGFSSHMSSKGETIFAFRPDAIGRYLDAYFEATPWSGYTSPRGERRDAARTRAASVHAAVRDTIHIRPKVGMYGAFARLNYKPWYALAEFVDNSIQSYLNNRDMLRARGVEGPLIVDVRIEDSQITVTDRAGGIALRDFPRAFSPSMRPPDPSGLSEFGLGMKAAACWFSNRWTVRTSALGEKVERTVTFDVPRIVSDGAEDLPIESRETRQDDHFTVIAMTELRQRPRGATVAKIKRHLGSMYRLLIADGVVRIRLTTLGSTEELTYEPPELLHAPYYRDPTGPDREWRAPIDIQLGSKRVTGWAGIMAKGAISKAGFAVFRRRRLIQGSVGDAYRPPAIFGSSNSFAYQRVVGELYVDGFDVSHTKDGIQWGDLEEEIIESIRAQIDNPSMPLLDQAAKYRARKKGEEVRPGFGREALRTTAAALAVDEARKVVADQLKAPLPVVEPPPVAAPPGRVVSQQSFHLKVSEKGQDWRVNIELVDTPGANWFETTRRSDENGDQVEVQINLNHPFSEAHLNDNEAALKPLVHVVAALALAEHIARKSGMLYTSRIRGDANELLRSVFSRPDLEEGNDA